uniref:Uncharacterized protein n=1 Tax=Fagus sylvatica TaxID=28930 RepID=A0A2N9IEQ0_FAGSY
MAPKKSVSEGPKKRLKSRAQRDETTSMDNTFRSSNHSVRFHDDIAHRTVKLDLAFYIGWHMDTCVKKKNGALPYGLHITIILNHFGVNAKKDAYMAEEMDEKAQMDEADAQGNEEAMQEDQEPPTAPSSSSRVNEDNFQLMFGRLDSLDTSMGNLMTSLDNFLIYGYSKVLNL